MIDIRNIIPEGTRDFTIEECNKRRKIIESITCVFNKWGYKEIITPTIEYYETFNHRTQSLKEENMYKFFDNNGRILVLRPDMTVPVARVVNTKFKEFKSPIRLYYLANVFRVHESLGGKKNEYLDCGIELIGVKGEHADVEVLVIALEVLKAIGAVDFKIELGNVSILISILNQMNLTMEEKEKLLELINNKSLITLKEYLTTLKIANEYKVFLEELPLLFGDYNMFEKVKGFSLSEETRKHITYLEKIFLALRELGYEKYISVDMSMVPRVKYYSGIIFKGYVSGIGSSILRGGRYDNLLESFGMKRDAIGFAIDVNSFINYVDYKEDEQLNKVEVNSLNYIDGLKEAIKSIENGERVEITYY